MTRHKLPTRPGDTNQAGSGIPPEIAELSVQLCVPHRSVAADIPAALDYFSNRGYLAQIKLDGMRCLALVDGTQVRLRSRRGDDLTSVYPEVVAALRTLNIRVVLDGELVAYGPDGKPAFTSMSWRNAQRNLATIARSASTVPVSFVAFDVLWAGGADLRHRPLTDRLAVLEGLPLSGRIQRCPTSDDPHELWERICELGLEGIVAKAPNSRYTGKRASSWVKVRETQRASVIVGAVTATAHRTIGKIEVHVIGPDGLISLGEVGTGFTQKELTDLARRLQRYAADPVNLPPVVVEVEFAGLYEDGALRFASFLGLRTDTDWTTATVDQPGLENAR